MGSLSPTAAAPKSTSCSIVLSIHTPHLPPFCDDQKLRYTLMRQRFDGRSVGRLVYSYLPTIQWNMKYKTIDSAYICALIDSIDERLHNLEGHHARLIRQGVDYLKKIALNDGHREKIDPSVLDDVTMEELFGHDTESPARTRKRADGGKSKVGKKQKMTKS